MTFVYGYHNLMSFYGKQDSGSWGRIYVSFAWFQKLCWLTTNMSVSDHVQFSDIFIHNLQSFWYDPCRGASFCCNFLESFMFSEILCLFQINPEAITVAKAALGNLLGGVGYFYGQSKISLPPSSKVSGFLSRLCANFFRPWWKYELPIDPCSRVLTILHLRIINLWPELFSCVTSVKPPSCEFGHYTYVIKIMKSQSSDVHLEGTTTGIGKLDGLVPTFGINKWFWMRTQCLSSKLFAASVSEIK